MRGAEKARSERGHHRDFFVNSNEAASRGEITVLEFLAEMREAKEKRAARFEARALRNELYYLGEQFVDVNEDTLDVEDMSWMSDVPQAYRNHTRNLVNTYTARILEERPDVVAYPSDASGYDQAGAAVADAFIYHQHSELDIDDLLHEVMTMAQLHGLCAIKVTWDPLDGPPSPGIPVVSETGEVTLQGKGEPTGRIDWSLQTIFDYGTDGAEHIEDSAYVWFSRYIDENEARIMLEANDVEEEPESTSYDDALEGECEGVEITEVWHRPTSRCPEGWYALVVGGHVVDFREEYPYDHHELPVAVIKIGKRRRSPYGSSHVDDAVPIQREINEAVSAEVRIVRETATLRFLGPPAVVEALEGGNHWMKVADKAQREASGWLEPPDLPPALEKRLERLVKELYDIFGLNEVLTGQENVKAGTSAKQIAYLTKLDSMKLSGTARNLGKALKRCWRQTLKLAQQFITDERLIQIVGPDKSTYVMAFRGAMLDGWDVRLEPRSGMDRYKAAVAAEADEKMAAFGPTPQLMEQSQTGLSQTYDAGQDRGLIQQQIMATLQGQPQPPLNDVDPAVAVEELRIAISILEQRGQRQQVQALYQLAMQYQQMQAQMQMGGQQQGAAFAAVTNPNTWGQGSPQMEQMPQ